VLGTIAHPASLVSIFAQDHYRETRIMRQRALSAPGFGTADGFAAALRIGPVAVRTRKTCGPCPLGKISFRARAAFLANIITSTTLDPPLAVGSITSPVTSHCATSHCATSDPRPPGRAKRQDPLMGRTMNGERHQDRLMSIHISPYVAGQVPSGARPARAMRHGGRSKPGTAEKAREENPVR